MAALRARGLVKSFGEGRAARRVLDGADLEVAAGEVVAVIGRSGSGKSTLLHLLGGLDRSEAGHVEVAGEPVTGVGERALSALRRRRIGFVFQFFHLLPELTGEANVLLAARLRGAHPDAERRGRELIARLGLGPVAGSLPPPLSGGEQ
jgi:ABC-type lipoprotein export system ATPase subunit